MSLLPVLPVRHVVHSPLLSVHIQPPVHFGFGLDFQQQLPDRLPARQVLLRLNAPRRVEAILLMYLEAQRAVRDHPEELGVVRPGLLRLDDVVPHSVGVVSSGYGGRVARAAHVGRHSLRFFADSLSGAIGGTAPNAFPTETSVPLRLSISKLLSNLARRQCLV
jgi:hypothetical protein